ncbi:MAG: putative rane protein, partial [Myxococcaceae bacterium]|nr:putative rane protein [Myxococcaceae bacterium]
MIHRISRVLLLAGATLLASNAYAGDPAAAQQLFSDAKKLIAENKWADACPKLEESQRLDPGMGTQFNLANCYEHVGKTASAWAAFIEVAGQAKAAGQAPREKAARDRANVLEPKLSKLTVTVR